MLVSVQSVGLLWKLNTKNMRITILNNWKYKRLGFPHGFWVNKHTELIGGEHTKMISIGVFGFIIFIWYSKI